jgi:hypothetical protein
MRFESRKVQNEKQLEKDILQFVKTYFLDIPWLCISKMIYRA